MEQTTVKWWTNEKLITSHSRGQNFWTHVLPALAITLLMSIWDKLAAQQQTTTNLPEIPPKTSSEGNDNCFCDHPELSPSYPGWLSEMYQFINKNLKHFANIEGKVFLAFTIWTNWEISNVKVVKSLHPLADAEAKRVVKMFPNWNPGQMYWKKMEFIYTLPITFKHTIKN